MRLALICGHVPSKEFKGPVVHLREGRWRISNSGVIDTIYSVVTDAPNVTPINAAELLGPCNARVIVENPGTEKHISVYAEEVT